MRIWDRSEEAYWAEVARQRHEQHDVEVIYDDEGWARAQCRTPGCGAVLRTLDALILREWTEGHHELGPMAALGVA